MHLYQLEVFCRVVEYRSFSRAAAELFISQPAVSQHVKALERTLGTRLLDRRRGELTLTEAGGWVYRFSQQILGAQREMRRMIEALRDGATGRVSVGASSTGVLYYLPRVLRRFRGIHPGIEVVLTSDITDRLRTAVAEGRIDVGLVWGPVSDPQLVAATVHRAPFVVICAPDHPLGDRPVVRPVDLSPFPFILNLPGTTTRHFVESALRGAGVIPQVAMEGTSTENIKKVVESGLGLAVVARRAVEPEVKLGTLRILPVAGLTLDREITLIVRKGRTAPGAVTRFAEFMQTAGHLFAEQEAVMRTERDRGVGGRQSPKEEAEPAGDHEHTESQVERRVTEKPFQA